MPSRAMKKRKPSRTSQLTPARGAMSPSSGDSFLPSKDQVLSPMSDAIKSASAVIVEDGIVVAINLLSGLQRRAFVFAPPARVQSNCDFDQN